MRTALLSLAMAFLGSLANGQPGGLLPSADFPEFVARRSFFNATDAGEGKVYIAGEFDRVDGVARPGFARLRADGCLDEAFRPEGLEEFGLSFRRGNIHALPDGVLAQVSFDELVRYDLAGRVMARRKFGAEAGFLSTEYVQGNEVVVRSITDGVTALLRLSLETLEDIEVIGTADDFGYLPLGAAPSASGGTWVLLARSNSFFPIERTRSFLVEVAADGSFDPPGPENELDDSRSYFLEGGSSGFVLGSRFINPYSLTSGGQRADFYDLSGNKLHEVSVSARSFVFDRPFKINDAGTEIVSLAANLGETVTTVARIDRADGSFTDVPIGEVNERVSLVDLSDDDAILFSDGVRLAADDGKVEGWRGPRLQERGSPRGVSSVANGDLLISGDFDWADGFVASGAVRLDPAMGALDESFRPDLEGRKVRQMLSRQDGEIYAWLDDDIVGEDGVVSPVVQLNERGEVVRVFDVFGTGENGLLLPFPESVVGIAVQADDSLLVETQDDFRSQLPIGVRAIDAIDIVPSSRVRRFSSTGEEDIEVSGALVKSMNPVLSTGEVLFEDCVRNARLECLDVPSPLSWDKPVAELSESSLLFERRFSRQVSGSDVARQGVNLIEWSRDTGAERVFATLEGVSSLTDVVVLPDRSVVVSHGAVVFTDLTGIRVFSNSRVGSEVIRLRADGSVDPTFRLVSEGGAIFSMLALPDNRLFLVGDFESLNGVTADGMAFVDNSRVYGFSEYMAAAGGGAEMSRLADADGDGAANFYEYAAGTDPFLADSGHASPEMLPEMTFRVWCNPDAPEVSRVIEVSTDGQSWRRILPGEGRLEVQADCLTWQLNPVDGVMMTRVRVEDAP